MEELQVRPKKSLGQNFLNDSNIARKIVSSLSPNHEDVVLEIGAGHGVLTKYLVKEVKRLIAVEIDKRLFGELNLISENHSNFQLIAGDFLKIDLDEILKDEKMLKVVGNIPYHITSSIIFKIFRYRKKVQSLTLMMQREVARRIVSGPNSKEYGILSVLSSYYADVKILFNVSRNVFFPKPKVDSAVVQWNFLPASRYYVADEEFFIRMVKSLFGQRRKVIKNSIKSMDLGELDIDFPMNVRPEQLSVAEFVRLNNLIAYGRKRP